jgi:hypothetical protein
MEHDTIGAVFPGSQSGRVPFDWLGSVPAPSLPIVWSGTGPLSGTFDWTLRFSISHLRGLVTLCDG